MSASHKSHACVNSDVQITTRILETLMSTYRNKCEFLHDLEGWTKCVAGKKTAPADSANPKKLETFRVLMNVTQIFVVNTESL